MPISDKTRQPYGLLHGGITMALVESAASIHASWGMDLSLVVPVGIEINGSHVRSATEGTVRAVGKVVRRSRSMIVHQVDVYLVETAELLSTARMTNSYKPVKQENKPMKTLTAWLIPYFHRLAGAGIHGSDGGVHDLGAAGSVRQG